MHSNIAALEPVGDSTSSSVAGDDSRSVIPAVKSVVRVDGGGGAYLIQLRVDCRLMGAQKIQNSRTVQRMLYL